MRIRVWEGVCAFFLSAAMANAVWNWLSNTATVNAQSTAPSSWTGVWQGELGGLPSTILTLAADDGRLQGTLVLNGISGEGGTLHIAVHEVHALLNLRADGKTLAFQLKQVRRSNTTLDFTVEQTSSSQANIHCLNCGNDAPTVEIIKQD
jgi:hypothetical protein